MAMDRRMLLLATACLPACATASLPLPSPAVSPAFAHGVASGDPRDDRVVLWTRLTPIKDLQEAEVLVEVALDPDFTHQISSAKVSTNAARDWTVRLDAMGLEPATRHFYRFSWEGQVSATGRTKTLPTGDVARLRIAVVSCANHAQGHFNVYGAIANEADIDAVIHLGDYIYEYGPSGYAGADGAVAGRAHVPAHEAITLSDYRSRHGQYKLDPQLQAMHAAHPVIAIWDDHEVANNAWKGGAIEHDASEGDYAIRRQAALQAYLEWMPVREAPDGAPQEQRYKTVRFGNLAALHLLETRLSARDRPIDLGELPDLVRSAEEAEQFRSGLLADPHREKLGAIQLAQLRAELDRSKALSTRWTLLGNPTLLASVKAPDISPYVSAEDLAELETSWSGGRGFITAARYGLPITLDAWDGYPAERERLFDAIEDSGVGQVLVLTGDSHAWWANELKRASGRKMGVELAVSSVTAVSPFSEANLGKRAADFALLVNRENPSVRYVSGRTHGYIDLVFTRQRADAAFRAVRTISEPDTSTFREASFRVFRKGGQLELDSVAGLGFREWILSG